MPIWEMKEPTILAINIIVCENETVTRFFSISHDFISIKWLVFIQIGQGGEFDGPDEGQGIRIILPYVYWAHSYELCTAIVRSKLISSGGKPLTKRFILIVKEHFHASDFGP